MMQEQAPTSPVAAVPWCIADFQMFFHRWHLTDFTDDLRRAIPRTRGRLLHQVPTRCAIHSCVSTRMYHHQPCSLRPNKAQTPNQMQMGVLLGTKGRGPSGLVTFEAQGTDGERAMEHPGSNSSTEAAYHALRHIPNDSRFAMACRTGPQTRCVAMWEALELFHATKHHVDESFEHM